MPLMFRILPISLHRTAPVVAASSALALALAAAAAQTVETAAVEPEPVIPAARTEAQAQAVEAEPVVPAADSSSATGELRFSSLTVAGVRLHLLRGDARGLALDLIDQPDGPGSRFADAAAVAAANPGLIAVGNGGFFDPQGKPLGLRRDGGETLAELVPPGTLYHGVVGDDGTQIRIETRAEWTARPSRDQEAVQTGPRLVWDGAAVPGLDSPRRAWRSFVALGENGEFLLGQSSLCSLGELAAALDQLTQPPLTRALNLDGGRSCDLWISPEANAGAVFQSRAPFANPVRDFVGLRRR